MKKKKYKSILSIILTLFILVSSLNINSIETNAKTKNVNIVLKYKNKKIVLVTYAQNNKGYNRITKQAGVKEIAKKFKIGKYYKEGQFSVKNEYGGFEGYNGWYYYKSKKDWISIELLPIYIDKYGERPNPPSKAYFFDIRITSTKFSINGIKVGMSRKKASSILDKTFKKVEHCWKKFDKGGNHSFVPSSNCSRGQIWVDYKGNKVSSIYYTTNRGSCDCRGHSGVYW